MAATWLVEEGIGETRAALVEGGTILAARIDWAGKTPAPGLVAQARVASRLAGTGAARSSNLPMARWRWSMA
jgi:hypothetical protein